MSDWVGEWGRRGAALGWSASLLFVIFVSGWYFGSGPDWLQFHFNPFEWRGLLSLTLAIPAAWLVFRHPSIGLYALLALLYSNASEIGVRRFNLPSSLQLLTLALVALVLALLWFRKIPLPTDPLFLILMAYGLWILATSIWAADPGAADDAFLEFAKGFLVICIVVTLTRSQTILRRSVWVLIATGAFLGTLTLLAAWSGLGDLWGFARTETAQIVGGVRRERFSGPLGDPNFYAQILIVLVPVSLYQLWEDQNWKFRLLAGYALTVILLATIYTFSRGAILALVVILFLAALQKKVRPQYILATLLALSPILYFTPEQVERRLGTLEQLIPGNQEVVHLDSSFRQRTLYMRTAWVMFSENPWVGVGAGNYSEQYQSFAARVGSVVSSYEDFGKPRFPHSLYLEVAAETGLIGLTLFSALTLTALLYYFLTYLQLRERDDGFAHLSFSLGLGFSGYLITSFFLHGHYILYFWLLVGLSIAVRTTSTIPSGEETGADA